MQVFKWKNPYQLTQSILDLEGPSPAYTGGRHFMAGSHHFVLHHNPHLFWWPAGETGHPLPTQAAAHQERKPQSQQTGRLPLLTMSIPIIWVVQKAFSIRIVSSIFNVRYPARLGWRLVWYLGKGFGINDIPCLVRTKSWRPWAQNSSSPAMCTGPSVSCQTCSVANGSQNSHICKAVGKLGLMLEQNFSAFKCREFEWFKISSVKL